MRGCRGLGTALLLCGFLPGHIQPAPFQNHLQSCLPGQGLAGSNPALLAETPGWHVDWSLTSLYGMRELTEVAAGLRLARGRWGGSLHYAAFGGELYQENSLGIACGFRATPLIAGGMRLRVLWQQGWEIRSRGVVAFDLEMLLNLSDRLSYRSTFCSINEPRTGRTEASIVPLEMIHTLTLRCTALLTVGLFFRSIDEGRDSLPGIRIAFGSRGCTLETYIVPVPYTLSCALTVRLGRLETLSGIRANREGLGLTCFTAGSIRLSPLPSSATNQVPERIDINRADSTLLCRLPGIKPGMADAIIRHRKLHGPFKRTRDLCRIRGLGYHHFVRIVGLVSVDSTGRDTLPLREKSKTAFQLNSAEMRELTALGISPDQARLLILFRERIGGFATLRELALVPGLQERTRKILGDHHE